MFFWSLVLFILGITAFLDSQFNYGYMFRTANSLVFMLVSLGILVRTRWLAKLGFKEQLIENNDALKARIQAMGKTDVSKGNEKPVEEMAAKSLNCDIPVKTSRVTTL